MIGGTAFTVTGAAYVTITVGPTSGGATVTKPGMSGRKEHRRLRWVDDRRREVRRTGITRRGDDVRGRPTDEHRRGDARRRSEGHSDTVATGLGGAGWTLETGAATGAMGPTGATTTPTRRPPASAAAPVGSSQGANRRPDSNPVHVDLAGTRSGSAILPHLPRARPLGRAPGVCGAYVQRPAGRRC